MVEEYPVPSSAPSEAIIAPKNSVVPAESVPTPQPISSPTPNSPVVSSDDSENPNPKKKLWMIIGIVALVVIIVVGGAFAILSLAGGEDSGSEPSDTSGTDKTTGVIPMEGEDPIQVGSDAG